MSILILLIIGILSLILSKYLFNRWFNHLSIYVVTWGGMIFLYELKLLSYYDISLETWFVILGAYVSFLFGIITIFAARGINRENTGTPFKDIKIHQSGKILKYLALFFSLVGLLGAIQTWMVLFHMFGSLPKILLSGNTIYTLRVAGEIPGVIPYLVAFSLIGLFFSGIYTAVRNKFSLISFIPVIAIILKSIADFSRIQMLLGFSEFIATVILFRYLLISKKDNKEKLLGKRLILGVIIIVILIVSGATAVKTFRGSMESYKGTSTALKQTKSDVIISPSIYLYLSSNIGVLNKFLLENNEEASFGENTFTPIYNFLSKFDLAKNVSFNERGYFIPMWTNSATYLRELYADYGTVGIFLVPYLLGLLTTFCWIKFYYEFNLKYFSLLVYLFSLISLSWFSSMTKGGNWLISLLILVLMMPFMDKIIVKENR